MPGPAAPSTASISTVLEALRAAGERGDADAVAALLAPDVVFHSPLTARIRFEGVEEVTELHRDIFAVLEDVETTEPLTGDSAGSFAFHARVRGMELEITLHVRVNAQARVTELKVYARPLPSVAALFAALPPRVAGRRHGRLQGAVVASLTRPLAVVLRVADRLAPKLI